MDRPIPWRQGWIRKWHAGLARAGRIPLLPRLLSGRRGRCRDAGVAGAGAVDDGAWRSPSRGMWGVGGVGGGGLCAGPTSRTGNCAVPCGSRRADRAAVVTRCAGVWRGLEAAAIVWAATVSPDDLCMLKACSIPASRRGCDRGEARRSTISAIAARLHLTAHTDAAPFTLRALGGGRLAAV